MLSDEISKSAIRIFDHKSNVIGCGFFFGGKVFTCAHVINQAIAEGSASSEKPTGLVHFDFPLINSRVMLAGRITTWLPIEDIASLEVVSTLPENYPPTKFIKANDLWGHTFRAYGFPRGLDEGIWASGKILDRISNGWLEIEDMKQIGFFVQPGFSGGAVWDEQNQGIVGMIVGADSNLSNRVAYIIPVNKLSEFFPEIKKNAIDLVDADIEIIKELVDSGSYTEAYEKCRKALLINPHHPVLHLLSGISLLKGKGADRQHTNTLAKIEKHLTIACETSSFKPTALAILGIIKYDHYFLNGLFEGKPSIDQIKRDMYSSGPNKVDGAFINLVKASDGALAYLGLQ